MGLINRYITLEYLQYFSLCLFSLLAIGLTFSALAELDLLAEEEGGRLLFESMLSALPLLVEIILPISVLLGTILTYSNLSKSSEAVAMQAGGLSLYNLVRPVLIFAIGIAAFAYANQSYLAPLWGADKKLLLVRESQKDHAWRFFQGRLFYFKGINDRNKRAREGRVLELNDQGRIVKLENAQGLTEREGQVKYNVQRILTFENKSFSEVEGYKASFWAGGFPALFSEGIRHPRYAGIWDILNEIRKKTSGGENSSKEVFAIYQKFAALVGIYVMILLALPFSLFSQRAANVRLGIVAAIVLGFIFWLVEQIFAGLFEAGILYPSVAAFGGDAIFLILALTLIIRKKA